MCPQGAMMDLMSDRKEMNASYSEIVRRETYELVGEFPTVTQ